MSEYETDQLSIEYHSFPYEESASPRRLFIASTDGSIRGSVSYPGVVSADGDIRLEIHPPGIFLPDWTSILQKIGNLQNNPEFSRMFHSMFRMRENLIHEIRMLDHRDKLAKMGIEIQIQYSFLPSEFQVSTKATMDSGKGSEGSFEEQLKSLENELGIQIFGNLFPPDSYQKSGCGFCIREYQRMLSSVQPRPECYLTIRSTRGNVELEIYDIACHVEAESEIGEVTLPSPKMKKPLRRLYAYARDGNIEVKYLI